MESGARSKPSHISDLRWLKLCSSLKSRYRIHGERGPRRPSNCLGNGLSQPFARCQESPRAIQSTELTWSLAVVAAPCPPIRAPGIVLQSRIMLRRREFLLSGLAATAGAQTGRKIRHVDIVHHTHTDVGYTALPAVVREQ